jgi:flagellar protein FlbD
MLAGDRTRSPLSASAGRIVPLVARRPKWPTAPSDATNTRRYLATPTGSKGGAVILVTNKDGSTTALNVDRIERIELNNISQGHESNIYLVDGRRLVVEETPDTVIEQIVDAKARVIARALALSESERRVPTEAPGQLLRILPRGGDSA